MGKYKELVLLNNLKDDEPDGAIDPAVITPKEQLLTRSHTRHYPEGVISPPRKGTLLFSTTRERFPAAQGMTRAEQGMTRNVRGIITL